MAVKIYKVDLRTNLLVEIPVGESCPPGTGIFLKEESAREQNKFRCQPNTSSKELDQYYHNLARIEQLRRHYME